MLGILMAVLPYLGFPAGWKNFLFTLLGLGLALFAYLLHRDSKKENVVAETFENFSENSDFDETEDDMEMEKNKSE
jgi:flagellar biosynthesis component FlhA